MHKWWGNGPEGARAADPNRVPNVSNEQLEAWREMYSNAAAAGKGGDTPRARLELIERAIAERYGGR